MAKQKATGKHHAPVTKVAKTNIGPTEENLNIPAPQTQRWMLWGILALTAVVFANTLGAKFVNWDDHGYLWLNHLVQPISGTAIKQMFSDHTCGAYAPLVVLSYCVEHGFDKIVKPGELVPENFNPFVYHLTNVLLHLGTTALVYFFLKALGLRSWGLVFATALFGIHPMRVESVAWVTERKDVLYGLFYVAALWKYWQGLQQPEKAGKYYALTLLFGMLALFSKIQAVSLPLSMLTLDYLHGRNLKQLRPWLEKAPFFGLSLVFGLVGIHFIDLAEGLKDTGYSTGTRLLFAAWSLCAYLGKVLWPFNLSAYYPYPDLGKTPAYYYAAPILLAALAYGVWRSTRKTRVIAFGLLFFLVNIGFVLQIKGAGKAFLADRFTYIPYIGLFFILGHYVGHWIERGLSKTAGNSLAKIAPFAAGAFVLLCAVLTVRQNGTWKDSIALWDNVAKVAPQDYLAWNNKGLALDEMQRYEEAIQAYQRANQVNPSNYDSHHNLGVAYFKTQRYQDAVSAFDKAAVNKPTEPEIFYNRAQAQQQLKNYPAALADIEKAIQLNLKKPKSDIQLALGITYAGLNRHQEAIAAFDLALEEKKSPDIHYQKGNSYAALNDMASAIKCYNETVALKPDYTDAWNNMGNAYATQGNFSAALPAYDKALALDGSAANVWFNRGMARNSAGDKKGACEDWQKSKSLGYPSADVVLAQFCQF